MSYLNLPQYFSQVLFIIMQPARIGGFCILRCDTGNEIIQTVLLAAISRYEKHPNIQTSRFNTAIMPGKTGNSLKRRIVYALLLSICTALIPAAQADELPAIKNFRKEASESTRKQAPILVLFMTQTCPYCKIALKEFLLPMQNDPEYERKVILRQIDIGSSNKLTDFNGKITTQSKLAKALNIRAVPTVVIFDNLGQELARIEGLLTADFYQSYLDTAISESQAKMMANSR